MKPAAVIFDFDGVVVDSMAIHLEAWSQATREVLGIEIEGTLKATLVGRSTQAIGTLIAKAHGALSDAPKLVESKRRQLRNGNLTAPALPGVVAAFAYLYEQKMPFGIASNAPREFIEQTVAALGLHVPMIVGVEDVSRPKPAPDVFLLCAKRLKISVTRHPQTIVFEDSLHGLKAAADAGMYPIGVTTHHPRTELLGAGAKQTCADLAEAMRQEWLQTLPA